jgi:hypothetical protein
MLVTNVAAEPRIFTSGAYFRSPIKASARAAKTGTIKRMRRDIYTSKYWKFKIETWKLQNEINCR